jgi:Amt family ammonium transporter
MSIEWSSRGKPSVLGILSGAVCYWASVILKIRPGYDDSLDVFGVHGVWRRPGDDPARGLRRPRDQRRRQGPAGRLVNGHGGQILTQLYGVAVVGAFSAIATWIILKIADALAGLRVTRDEETEGLDTALHGERVQ